MSVGGIMNSIEKEILDKGLTAPRITLADIEDNIISVSYFTADEGVLGNAAYNCTGDTLVKDIVWKNHHHQPLELLTFCVLVLKNGFTVTGESACASPENYNEDIGRQIAYNNAVSKVWPLMGYELRNKLSS
jgi:hypothetical protein